MVQQSTDQLKKSIRDNRSASNFAAGDLVFKEGTPATGVYLILNNTVKLIKKDNRGNDYFIWFAKKGELIGLVSYFLEINEHCCSAVVAEKSSDLVFIPNEEFTRQIDLHAHLRNTMVATLCRRLRFMEYRTKFLLNTNKKERIIETMTLLCENKMQEEDCGNNVKLQYSVKELAQLTGTGPAFLRNTISELVAVNILKKERNYISICDLDKLRRYSVQS